jgi:hypothetical protein
VGSQIGPQSPLAREALGQTSTKPPFQRANQIFVLLFSSPCRPCGTTRCSQAASANAAHGLANPSYSSRV